MEPHHRILGSGDGDPFKRRESGRPDLSGAAADVRRRKGGGGLYDRPLRLSDAEDQQDIYDSRIREYEAQGYSAADAKKETEKWVAIPGTSEHQLGLSLDINADGVHSKGSDVYAWLQIHAADYGFIYRFPADKVAVTGISNEPWHYRYVGVELAHAIKDSGLCLEEYVAALEEDKAA